MSAIGENEVSCPICLKILYKPVTTYCGHTFCLECLQTAVAIKPSCPLCRWPCHPAVEVPISDNDSKSLAPVYNTLCPSFRRNRTPVWPPSSMSSNAFPSNPIPTWSSNILLRNMLRKRFSQKYFARELEEKKNMIDNEPITLGNRPRLPIFETSFCDMPCSTLFLRITSPKYQIMLQRIQSSVGSCSGAPAFVIARKWQTRVGAGVSISSKTRLKIMTQRQIQLGLYSQRQNDDGKKSPTENSRQLASEKKTRRSIDRELEESGGHSSITTLSTSSMNSSSHNQFDEDTRQDTVDDNKYSFRPEDEKLNHHVDQNQSNNDYSVDNDVGHDRDTDGAQSTPNNEDAGNNEHSTNATPSIPYEDGDVGIIATIVGWNSRTPSGISHLELKLEPNRVLLHNVKTEPHAYGLLSAEVSLLVDSLPWCIGSKTDQRRKQSDRYVNQSELRNDRSNVSKSSGDAAENSVDDLLSNWSSIPISDHGLVLPLQQFSTSDSSNEPLCAQHKTRQYQVALSPSSSTPFVSGNTEEDDRNKVLEWQQIWESRISLNWNNIMRKLHQSSLYRCTSLCILERKHGSRPTLFRNNSDIAGKDSTMLERIDVGELQRMSFWAIKCAEDRLKNFLSLKIQIMYSDCPIERLYLTSRLLDLITQRTRRRFALRSFIVTVFIILIIFFYNM